VKARAGVKPAFYALEPGGWRDYWTLLHPPYTVWHLSYVVVGGCLAPIVSWERLGLAVLAFFLALGIGAHALDELNGRPLRTQIPGRVLVALAVSSVAVAAAIGIAVAVSFSLWILPAVAVGAFLVPAYSLELMGGRLHTELWFGLAWGAFPVLTGYLACAGDLQVEAVLAAAWATLLSLAQRRLSTSVRRARRQMTAVTGEVELADGSRETVTRESFVAAPETALRLLAASTALAAAALAAFRI
jgi:heme O synthase-like polyprenyltransferase